MLSCRWCGLRPLEEFLLLDGLAGPDPSGTDGRGVAVEYWWHRLGCGLPVVVALEAAASDAIAAPPGVRARRSVPDVVAGAAVGGADRPGGAGLLVVAEAEADETVDLVGDPPVDYERPATSTVPAGTAGWDESAAAVTAGTRGSFSFNVLGRHTSLGGGGAGSDAEGDDVMAAEGGDSTSFETSFGDRAGDGTGDRFRDGLRHSGAQALSRPTGRPTPGRAPAARAPRQVRLTRRAPIAVTPSADRASATTGHAGHDATSTSTSTSTGTGTDRVEDVDAGPAGVGEEKGAAGGRGDVPEAQPATAGRGGSVDLPTPPASPAEAGPAPSRAASLFTRTRSDDQAVAASPDAPDEEPESAFAGALEEAIVEPPPRPPASSGAGRRTSLFGDPGDGDGGDR